MITTLTSECDVHNIVGFHTKGGESPAQTSRMGLEAHRLRGTVEKVVEMS